MPETRGHFSRRVGRALDDPSLQKALVQAMTGLRSRRNKAFENFDFEKGRADLKRRRQANLDRLPELLESAWCSSRTRIRPTSSPQRST
ncbi:MAG: hypothetical protein E6I83_11415 [Chloroflexi bacterium]|nr:MAG: hypothetical protein E6I83_11415 [Chloroflexota bacterium]